MIISSSVKWAFSLNQKDMLKILLSEFPEPFYWKYLDKLFTSLKESKCYNVPEKLQNINIIKNFDNCLAELEVARLFINKGKKVDIILDNDPSFKSEPDLLVTDSDFLTYVEVTRTTDDEILSSIATSINKIIMDLNFPFVVDVKLNRQASFPVYLHGRKEKNDLILNGLNEFKKKIEQGGIKIGMLITTQIGEFTFRRSLYKRGYPGIIESSVIIEDPDELYNLLKYKIISKAEKRESWTESQKMYKFVIVLVFNNPIHMDKLHKAVCDLITLGDHFSEKVTKNVNAVIGMFQSKTLFILNPFCEKKINDPKFSEFMKLTSKNH